MKKMKTTVIAGTLATLALLGVIAIQLNGPAPHPIRPHQDRPATSPSPVMPASTGTRVQSDEAGTRSSPRQRHAQPPRLADVDVEKLLRQPGAISLDASTSLLQSGDLPSHIAALRQQHAQDGDANDITALYRDLLVRSLAAFGRRMWLNDLQCGPTLCIGVITSEEAESVARAWPSTLLAARALPIFGYVDAIRPTGPGRIEYGFIFSTDPSAGGLRFKASPPR